MAMDATKHHEQAIEGFQSRCDPMSVRNDIFVVCAWMVELRRACPGELRNALPLARKHLAPANSSGLEDVLVQGSAFPSDGTALSLMTAQFSGVGSPGERVALESVEHIRLSRDPHTKRKFVLPDGVHKTDRALGYPRRLAKQTDNALVRTVAIERGVFCGSIRILYTLYAALGKGLLPPAIRLEGSMCARTLRARNPHVYVCSTRMMATSSNTACLRPRQVRPWPLHINCRPRWTLGARLCLGSGPSRRPALKRPSTAHRFVIVAPGSERCPRNRVGRSVVLAAFPARRTLPAPTY